MVITVAIVGRPNVGKSRLFNALISRKVAIVHDQPGVTRDPNTAELAPGLVLVDTGGWGLGQIKGMEAEAKALAVAVEEQVEVAIQAAEKILFVIDGRAGVTALDQQVAQKLRPYAQKVTLIVNKIDESTTPIDEGDFLSLGFSSWQLVSAEHGRGIQGVRHALLQLAPPVAKPVEGATSTPKVPTLCIVGRPNVGKSSLTNALLGQSKVIVSPISGTTRDSVRTQLSYKGKKGEVYSFTLVDTAGMRHRTKVGSPVEVFSQMRTRAALESADLAILVVDALDGVTTQDKLLAGEIQKSGKPIVVAINKWDLAAERFKGGDTIDGYETLQDFEAQCREGVEGALFFTQGAPIVFMSAKEGLNLDKLLQAAREVEARQDKVFATPEVNKLLQKLLWRNVPRNATGKIFRIYYATQTTRRPYRLRLFCNQDEGINDAFKRYLAKGFAEHFDAAGCPFFFEFVSKPRRPSAPPRQKKAVSRLKVNSKHRRAK